MCTDEGEKNGCVILEGIKLIMFIKELSKAYDLNGTETAHRGFSWLSHHQHDGLEADSGEWMACKKFKAVPFRTQTKQVLLWTQNASQIPQERTQTSLTLRFYHQIVCQHTYENFLTKTFYNSPHQKLKQN